jgi:hypothetical protein
MPTAPVTAQTHLGKDPFAFANHFSRRYEMLSEEELRLRERKRVMIAAGPLCVLLLILFFVFGAGPAVHAIKAFQTH